MYVSCFRYMTIFFFLQKIRTKKSYFLSVPTGRMAFRQLMLAVCVELSAPNEL